MFLVATALTLGAAWTITPDADADRVLSLPTLDPADFKAPFYAGYLTVDEHAGRKLFYIFAESQRNPATDPLVLWSNGGP